MLLRRKATTNLDGALKHRDITLLTKVHIVKNCLIPMGELDHKEGWAPKYWCFWTVVLEKTLESPLDCKEIKPVNPKGNHPWIFFGSTDAEAPIFCPPDAKSWLIKKDSAAGKDWRQKKWAADDKMVRQHHWLSGHEFEQTPRDGGGQRSLACFNPWDHKQPNMT